MGRKHKVAQTEQHNTIPADRQQVTLVLVHVQRKRRGDVAHWHVITLWEGKDGRICNISPEWLTHPPCRVHFDTKFISILSVSHQKASNHQMCHTPVCVWHQQYGDLLVRIFAPWCFEWSEIQQGTLQCSCVAVEIKLAESWEMFLSNLTPTPN